MAKEPRIAAKSVDEYLAALPDDVMQLLEKLRKTIKEAAPKAEESISYQIPTYKQNGPVIFFAAFKNHCSLLPVDKDVQELFAKELEGYKINNYTVQFTVQNPLPSPLVKKIVKLKLKKNEERVAKKKGAK